MKYTDTSHDLSYIKLFSLPLRHQQYDSIKKSIEIIVRPKEFNREDFTNGTLEK